MIALLRKLIGGSAPGVEYRDMPLLSRNSTVCSQKRPRAPWARRWPTSPPSGAPAPSKSGGGAAGQDQRGQLQRHISAYPDVDWHQFSEGFVTSLGLTPCELHHPDQARRCRPAVSRRPGPLRHHIPDRLLTVTSGVYISLGHFKHAPSPAKSALHTMPHKVNPILRDFEGNLGPGQRRVQHLARQTAHLPLAA